MKLKIAGLALMASCSAVMAADMPSAVPYQKAPYIVDPGTNWTGFYIGAMGGYGWSDSVRTTIGGLAFTASSSDLKGGFGGGTLGYNWQSGQAVFGIETDAAWSDIKYSETAFGITLADKLQSFGSVTGRIGLAANAALFYVKGGYAWADNQISASALGATFSESHVHSGWTIGGGLEYMFVPNWSGKVEYMYSDYRNASYLTAFAPGGVGLGVTVNTVKAGVNYHFGGPVVARY
ncbi:MAG: outer membrane beta-barrel protein [Bradyrhizobium sp.]